MLEYGAMGRASNAVSIEQLFRVFADRTRLRLINLLGDEEVCVCFLTEILKSPQPTISRHLSYLKRAGLVASRRDGKWMHYRLIPPTDAHAATVFQQVKNWLFNDKGMQEDRQRLMKFCCATELPTQLQGAPKPNAIGKRSSA